MANNQTKLDNNPVGVRSNQNLSYNWLGSADFGRIVPFYWQELIGKDQTKTVKPNFEVQMLPFASPIFGKMDIYAHFFFVPHRLVWKDAGQFFAQTGIGKSAKAPTWKLSDFRTAYNHGTNDVRRGLFKHWTSFGLPPFFNDKRYNASGSSSIKDDEITLLPFRAYNQIWWDFYRDPELISDDSKQNYLRDTSGVDGNTAPSMMQYYPKIRQIKDTWISELFASNGLSPKQDYLGDTTNSLGNVITSLDGSHSQNHRRVEALTRIAERLSLSGKREIDMLFSQYGIKPEWQKLNMCEYVGGGKAPIIINDIVSAADTSIETAGMDGSPLGAKAASGYSSLNDLTISYTAKEPGILMGVFSIMPKIHFVPGIGRQWYRKDRYDFYRDELEHVGQVAVPKKEIAINYATGSVDPEAASYTSTSFNEDENNNTFAFTQPYYDYKRGTDVLAGDFMFYHNVPNPLGEDKNLLYMQSMGMFYDYPDDRNYNSENMAVDSVDANQVFYYYGGRVFTDTDDHFHVNIGIQNVIERPMDGYAIPTLETTEDPHASKAPIGNSTVL